VHTLVIDKYKISIYISWQHKVYGCVCPRIRLSLLCAVSIVMQQTSIETRINFG